MIADQGSRHRDRALSRIDPRLWTGGMIMGEGVDPGEKRHSVKIDYIKSDGFRVVHVDGAIGTVTPRGYLCATFFNERMALPRSTTHDLMPDGSLGDPIEMESRRSVVRNMEVALNLDKEAVRALIGWLSSSLSTLEAYEAQIEQERG